MPPYPPQLQGQFFIFQQTLKTTCKPYAYCEITFTDFADVYTSGQRGCGQLIEMGYVDAQHGGRRGNTGADVFHGTDCFDLTRCMR